MNKPEIIPQDDVAGPRARHKTTQVMVGDVAVGEASSKAVGETLKTAAKAAGFSPKAPVVEISGVCAHCRGV